MLGLPAGVVPAAAWTNGLRTLERDGVDLPGRSTSEPVDSWVSRTNKDFPRSPVDALVHVVSAGVAVADLHAVARPEGQGQTSGPNWVAKYLSGRLTIVDVALPGVGVRDALGWIMTVGVESAVQVDRLRSWASVGPAGWVYAAAGFTPTEAVRGLDAGTLDRDAALALAGLRGAVMPIGRN